MIKRFIMAFAIVGLVFGSTHAETADNATSSNGRLDRYVAVLRKSAHFHSMTAAVSCMSAFFVPFFRFSIATDNYLKELHRAVFAQRIETLEAKKQALLPMLAESRWQQCAYDDLVRSLDAAKGEHDSLKSGFLRLDSIDAFILVGLLLFGFYNIQLACTKDSEIHALTDTTDAADQQKQSHTVKDIIK